MQIKSTNLTINVADIDKSISFYKSIGFSLKERWENHYAQLIAPGIMIGLHPFSNSALQGSSGILSIGFIVNDFEASKNSLIQLGIAIKERTEEGGDFLHFNDPDGTSLYIIQPKW